MFQVQSSVEARLDVVEGGYLKTSLACSELKHSIELVQTEDRFNEVKDALKTLNKMDFDKLISSVWLP